MSLVVDRSVLERQLTPVRKNTVSLRWGVIGALAAGGDLYRGLLKHSHAR
ncbi:MAG: hypothetical protein QW514_07280 [Thermoprotei archaeon]